MFKLKFCPRTACFWISISMSFLSSVLIADMAGLFTGALLFYALSATAYVLYMFEALAEAGLFMNRVYGFILFTRKVLQAGKLELKGEDTDCTAWKEELVKISEIKISRKTP